MLYPLVWLANLVANGVLRLMGVNRDQVSRTSLSSEELRTVVAEASTVIPHRHQRMLMSILDLEKITVDDIMVPRSDIGGIDLDDDWDDILEQIRDCRHTRVPVYDGELESLVGILHMKKVARMLVRGELEREQLVAMARTREPYYVPEGTSLNQQLLQFQRQRRRVAFIVDEYGDVQGLVTLEDLLEEIVGEFTSDTSILHKDVHRERNDSFVVNASASVRTLNRKMGWALPTTGPRTLNGLIVEQMETIPTPGQRLRIGDYSLEVLQSDRERGEDRAAVASRRSRSSTDTRADTRHRHAVRQATRPAMQAASDPGLVPELGKADTLWLQATGSGTCPQSLGRPTRAGCNEIGRDLLPELGTVRAPQRRERRGTGPDRAPVDWAPVLRRRAKTSHVRT